MITEFEQELLDSFVDINKETKTGVELLEEVVKRAPDLINIVKKQYEKEWVEELEKKHPDLNDYNNGIRDAKIQLQIPDEQINALSWTITFLKSKLWLFSKPNGETINYLEEMLDKIKNERR